MNAAKNGDTVKLLADYENDLTVTKRVTLDLNGHAIASIEVGQTDEDTGDVLAGDLTVNGGTIGDGRDGIKIQSGTLTVNGGAIDFLYGGDSGSGMVTITGGIVKNARFGSGFNITVIGGSYSEDCFAFISQLDAGDRVDFTDVQGVRYSFTVWKITHRTAVDTDALDDEEAPCVLFTEKDNLYLIVHCIPI